MKHSFLLLAGAAFAGALVTPRAANACGGCFVPQTERTVVTDHRMALSVSPTQTVLWDQIRYSGDPAEFAWVLPVRAGAKLQVSNDEWFTALDASTQPVVYQPNTYGGGYGCALTGCGSETTSSAESAGGGQVQVISEQVVGPYETVTLRATEEDALTNWLRSHAYDIPAAIEPTIKAYVTEGFDFIALRLRPECGERSMQPVRVVTEGADPTLPLRMVAAGVGARVGITLYVITEGRWQPQNFRHAEFDEARLRWDRFQGRSNYDDVSQDIMGQDSGRTWLTEYANKPQLPTSVRLAASQNPGLTDAYFSLCRSTRSSSTTSPTGAYDAGNGGSFTPCPKSSTDAGGQYQQPEEDAGADASTDAGDDAGGDASADTGADASSDAGQSTYTPPAEYTGDLRPPHPDCAYLDDLEVALNGLHREDVWVTRLRALLPSDALSAGDLRLEPAAAQTAVNNVHYASYYTDDDPPASSKSSCLSSPTEHRAFGSWALGACAAVGLVAWARRRRRAR